MRMLIDRYRRHRARRSRGQSLTEFALFLPVLLLIVLMALDFGRVYLGYVNLMQSARIAANFAATNPDATWGDPSDPIRQRYEELITRDAATINCTLPNTIPIPTFPDGTDLGQRAVAAITCDFDLLTPFIGAVISNPVNVEAEAQFPIRVGGVNGVPVGTAVPTGSPGPTPTPSPTPPPGPIVAAFCGTGITAGASGGCGTPLAITGVVTNGNPNLVVTWDNLSTGPYTTQSWNFGDGAPIVNVVGTADPPNHTYSDIGSYTVTLTVSDGVTNVVEVKSAYVTLGCEVPAFSGNIRKNNAQGAWDDAGFTTAVQFQPGNGNYMIQFQSIPNGPAPQPEGCDSVITVGP